MCRCSGRHLCPDVPVCNFVSRKHDVSRHINMTSLDTHRQTTYLYIYILAVGMALRASLKILANFLKNLNLEGPARKIPYRIDKKYYTQTIGTFCELQPFPMKNSP